MQKIKILFPDSLMTQLKEEVEQKGIPIDEIINKAAKMWLEQLTKKKEVRKSVPVINAGSCLLSADRMKEAFYA